MTERAHPDAVIARLARGQHGLFTIDQARDAGLTYDQLRHRVRVGALLRLDRGVYVVPAAPPTWHQNALAALLAVGGDAVLYRRSAATAWQLCLSETARVEVACAAPRGWRAASPRIVLHRVAALDHDDRANADGLPVTSVARTLVDLAGKLRPTALTRVVDDALARRLLTPMALESTARRLATQGRARVAVLLHIIDPWLRGPAFDSVAEASCARALASAGLPEPVRQYPCALADGTSAKIDFAWPNAMVALEVDGFRWHANASSHARDSLRANWLAAAGWVVIRTTPTELAERPGAVLDALRHRLGSPHPAGALR